MRWIGRIGSVVAIGFALSCVAHWLLWGYVLSAPSVAGALSCNTNWLVAETRGSSAEEPPVRLPEQFDKFRSIVRGDAVLLDRQFMGFVDRTEPPTLYRHCAVAQCPSPAVVVVACLSPYESRDDDRRRFVEVAYSLSDGRELARASWYSEVSGLELLDLRVLTVAFSVLVALVALAWRAVLESRRPK